MQSLTDKRHAAEIVRIFADDIIDIRIDNFRGEHIAHRIEMMIQVEDLLVFFIIPRSVSNIVLIFVNMGLQKA